MIHLNSFEVLGKQISVKFTLFQFGNLIFASIGILSLSQKISSLGEPVNQNILKSCSTSDSPENKGSPNASSPNKHPIDHKSTSNE